MKENWVKILQGLRAQKNFALFALVSSLEEITFTPDKIIVQTNNDTEYQMLMKNLPLLQGLCGGDFLEIKARPVLDQAQTNLYLEKLQELFGDKLEIL